MAPGISHDKHLGIETLEVRKLTERILNIRRMLYLKEAIGHHHIAAQRIRLKPHNVYRATPIHEFLIGERRNFRQCGDFAQLHIDTSPDSADRMLHIHPTSSRSLLQLRIVSYLAKFYFFQNQKLKSPCKFTSIFRKDKIICEKLSVLIHFNPFFISSNLIDLF